MSFGRRVAVPACRHDMRFVPVERLDGLPTVAFATD